MTELNKTKKEPEIRYVPVEFLEGYVPSSSDEVEIDFMDILKRIWDGRKAILKITVVFVIIGIIYAISMPNEYTTTVKLLPEVQNNISNLGRFGGLAAQFGIGGSAGASGSDVLPVQLYPEILTSIDFLYEIVSKKIYFEELSDSMTIQSYFNEHQKSNAFIGYTIGLPFKVLGLLRSAPDSLETPVSSIESYRRISPRVMESIGGLRQSVTNNREQQTGVLTLTVTTQAPEVTVQIANHVTDALSTYLTEYRTEKARRNLEFIQQRQVEAKSNFELEQDRLARFRDQNQGNLTAATRTIEQNIQSEYNVKFSVYSSLTEQLEQAQIKLEEDTPVISVIQLSLYPNKKSGPNRIFQIVTIIFFGFFLGILWVLLKSVLNKVATKVRTY